MIYDITQELFSCKVFPGDPAPACEVLGEIAKGDKCNLTAFSMCSHNGTHIDAPAHFLVNGKTVDQLDPAIFLGDCYVTRHEGDVTAPIVGRVCMDQCMVDVTDLPVDVSCRVTLFGQTS